jgi:ribosomal protein S18 acetylase RimI-like enzyme
MRGNYNTTMVDTMPSMRLATAADCLNLEEMEIKLFPDNCMNAHTLQNELELGVCWVYCFKDDIWGYCLVRRDGDLLDILRLGVLREHRGIGVGELLLEKVLQENKPTMLTVKKDNTNALRLYMKHGFRIVGYLAGENGFVMKRVTS